MGEVSWVGLVASFTLIALAVALSLVQRLDLERSILWASARAAVQLLAIGVVLDWIIQPNRPLVWSWCWVIAMAFIAAFFVRSRAPEVPGVYTLALGAYALALPVTLGVLFGLGVFDLEARTLIPMAGLTIGNSMAATVLVARRLYDEIRDKREEVEARLALGLTADAAAKPFVRSALRTALIPQVETTKAVGLVVLPGAMTGLILAGVEPFQAIKVQLVVMYLILGAVATTTTVVALGVQRRLFTKDDRLVRMPRPASG